MSSAAWHVPEMCLSSGCFKELYTYIHNMVRRDEPNEPNKPKNEETAEERRKRLAEAEARRVRNNAYCGNIRWETLKDSVLTTVTLGLLGAAGDRIERGQKVTIDRMAKGAATKTAIIIAFGSTIRDISRATNGDARCGQGLLD
jgi:hypothetical protein